MSLTRINVNNSLVTNVDDIPTAGSDNLVKSKGVLNKIFKITEDLFADSEYGKYFDFQGVELSAPNVTLTPHIYGMAGETIVVQTNNGSSLNPIASYDQNGTFISLLGRKTYGSTLKQNVVIPDNIYSIRIFSFTVWDGTSVNFFAKVDKISELIKPELFARFGEPGYYFDDSGQYLPLSGEWEATELIPVKISGKVIHLNLLLGNARIAVACYGAGGQDDFIRVITVTGTPSSIYEGMYDIDEDVYIDDINCKYIRIQSATTNGYIPTAQATETDEYIIVSATDADAKYTNFYDCLKNESAGNKKIYLPDAEYVIQFSEQQPAIKLNIKAGWEIYGNGIDVTTIKYTATSTSFSTNWLDIIGSCKMHDLTILNIYPSNMEVTNMGYCLHIDLNVDGLRFECERVRCKVDPSNRIDPQTGEIDSSPYGLVLGLGTWYGQEFIFKNCWFEIGVLHNRSGILNFHNQPYIDKLPSNTVFEGCYFGNAASSVHIADLAGNAAQVKNGLAFIGCTIKSFVTFERLGSAKPNSYNLNFSGSHFYGLTGFTTTVDPHVASYSQYSLPACDQIDFIKNNSGSQIVYGKFVKKTRNNISGTWHYDEPGMVVTGISEAGANDFIHGVSLVTVNDGDMGHVINKGVICINGYTIDSGVSAGDYIKLSANNTIIKATLNTNVVYLGDNFIELL